LYSSSDIIREIKSRRKKRAGHVACMGERRKLYRVLVGKDLRERDHLEELSVDGRMGLECILGR
jgi:hypothetical protein